MKNFDYVNMFKTSLIGGVAVIIPVAILLGIFGWLFSLTRALINPITLFIVDKSGFQEFISFIFAIVAVVFICFLVGAIVKTRLGSFYHLIIENEFLCKIPFYKTIKEIFVQFFSSEKQPFSKVALVDIFNNDTLMTAFVTDESINEKGKVIRYTVFVPTGPNPTSGNIYHLKPKRVAIVDVCVEEAMKSIIACGSGSNHLIEEYNKDV